MRNVQSTNPRDLVLAAGLAILCALAFSTGLSRFSSPKGLPERIAALEKGVSDLKLKIASRTPSPGLPAGALCRGDIGQQASSLSETFRRQATALQLDPRLMDVTPVSDNRGHITPLNVHLIAQGSYDGVVSFLAFAAQASPTLYVDRMDLSSKSGGVNLNIYGRVLCAD